MVKVRFSGFDWDAGNLEKCRKHGLSLSEIEAVLKRESTYIGPDIRHSETEERFLAIGTTPQGRPTLIGFTLRKKGNETLIRPVTARYMHQKEVHKYGQRITPLQNG